jgi:hypothetical protein
MIYSYHYRNSSARRAAFWFDALGLLATVVLTLVLYVLLAAIMGG